MLTNQNPTEAFFENLALNVKQCLEADENWPLPGIDHATLRKQAEETEAKTAVLCIFIVWKLLRCQTRGVFGGRC